MNNKITWAWTENWASDYLPELVKSKMKTMAEQDMIRIIIAVKLTGWKKTIKQYGIFTVWAADRLARIRGIDISQD
jgi:hypothetical protein